MSIHCYKFDPHELDRLPIMIGGKCCTSFSFYYFISSVLYLFSLWRYHRVVDM